MSRCDLGVQSSFEEAVKLSRSGNHKAAFKLYIETYEMAEALSKRTGNKLSNIVLQPGSLLSKIADSYFQGIGTNVDYEKAIKFTMMAADYDDVDSLYNLGRLYLTGEIVNKDINKAIQYLKKSAAKGDVESIFLLGSANDECGNCELAFKCYLEAAERGNPSAQHDLAVCYLNGEGTNQDNNKAYYWFQKAAAQGHQSAIRILNNNR